MSLRKLLLIPSTSSLLLFLPLASAAEEDAADASEDAAADARAGPLSSLSPRPRRHTTRRTVEFLFILGIYSTQRDLGTF